MHERAQPHLVASYTGFTLGCFFRVSSVFYSWKPSVFPFPVVAPAWRRGSASAAPPWRRGEGAQRPRPWPRPRGGGASGKAAAAPCPWAAACGRTELIGPKGMGDVGEEARPPPQQRFVLQPPPTACPRTGWRQPPLPSAAWTGRQEKRQPKQRESGLPTSVSNGAKNTAGASLHQVQLCGLGQRFTTIAGPWPGDPHRPPCISTPHVPVNNVLPLSHKFRATEETLLYTCKTMEPSTKQNPVASWLQRVYVSEARRRGKITLCYLICGSWASLFSAQSFPNKV